MHQSRRLFSLLAILALAGLLAACGGGGKKGALKGGGGQVSFDPSDLAGDWNGLFQPGNPLKEAFNFVVRFNGNGAPVLAADGLGHEWTRTTASMSGDIDTDGTISFTFSTNGGGQWELVLAGTMNEGKDKLKGSYELTVDGIQVSAGQFETLLSSGAGQFQTALLEGAWEGVGYKREAGRHRRIHLGLDASGTVTGGDIEIHTFIQGGVNTGIFGFSDDSLGRIDNVVMQSTDGSTQTFHFLLVNREGTVASGPGTDSTMGTGVVRLYKP